MWRTAILVPLALIFHLGNVLSALPKPLAFFPLDGTFQTRESENRSLAGVASNAILAPGPDGNPDGSFQLSSGDDSSITFPNNGALETMNSITMLAWVYITSSTGLLFQYLYSIPNFGVGLSINGQNLIFVVASTPVALKVDGTPFSLLEEWVHLGISYSGSTGVLTLFVNGKDNKNSSGGPLTIDTRGDIVTNFGGRISQLRVYDVVLSEEQVQLVLQGCAELDDITATVNCGNNGRDITITIDQIADAQHWIGREDQWRLNQYENDSCRPNFGLCSVSFGPFIGEHCTDVRSTSEDIIYTFRINTTVDLENLANLTVDHSYLFTCKYPRNGTTQTTFVTLSGIEDIANGVNALDFTLELFSDSNKEQAITSAIYPGSRIYVRVGLAHHFEEQLDLFLTECYTSTDQAGNLNRHNLIYNIGCSLDVVTEYSCSTQTNDTECFLTEIRRYAHQSQIDVVWLHCTVIACLSSSLCQTLCADCPTDRRRKRSTTELANQNEAIIYQLHSGPYRIVGMEEGPTHFSDITVEEREKLNTSAQVVVILMVSSVVAVAIMCVTVIVVLRKRALILTSSQSSVSGKAFENQGCETTDTNNKI